MFGVGARQRKRRKQSDVRCFDFFCFFVFFGGEEV